MNRHLRLAPGFVLVALLSYVLLGNDALDGASWQAVAAVILSHVTMLGQDAMVFLSYDATGAVAFAKNFRALPAGQSSAMDFLLVPQGWTLGVEALFYLCVPILMPRRVATLLPLAFALLGLHALLFYAMDLRGDPWTYRFFPFALPLFLFGACAFKSAAWLGRQPWFTPARAWTFAAIMALAIAYPVLPGGGSEKRWAFVALLALALPAIFDLSKRWAWDRHLGAFSFPLYIAHVLCFEVGLRIGAGDAAKLAMTALLSAVIVYGVELPIDRWRARLAAKSVKAVPTLCPLDPVISDKSGAEWDRTATMPLR